ncbi:segmentation protein cap'n'collar isoform X2 [Microplitis mediator]|uniref:segmentation protein cap'n'collar isoform X2 n=1 Tax=Microplitis mediator TaxID=375433 RepID=UPI0025527E5E|nr:segmentation protein cap'n'collar isoform X2 [Microplitis mediator]
MLGLKKLYREELLQLALILSILRVDPESYLGIDIQNIGVGLLDLNNGSGWHTDSQTIAIHRPTFIHPKNPDSSMLLSYERDLFEELNSLGRYNNRLDTRNNDIHAYLLNIEDAKKNTTDPGPSINDSSDRSDNVTSADQHVQAQTPSESAATSELTQEDMDLIEVLWKQDVDLGFTMADVERAKTESSSSQEKKVELDDIEKLKVDTVTKKEKEEVAETDDNPWAGLSYTVDVETGEYILESPISGTSASESTSTRLEAGVQVGALNDPEIGLTSEDSLGLSNNFGLEDDFPSELLSDSLLAGSGVEGLLCNDSLGLPDGFNLEEALQLVGLNEQPESQVAYGRRMGGDQRWTTDLFLSFPGATDFGHPSHPGYPGHGLNSSHHYDMQRNVVLNNATLPLPVGDYNSTGPFQNIGPSNLGSAVATSMNLTNSSEPIGTDTTNGSYKTEPHDMNYTHYPHNPLPSEGTLNQTDGLFSNLLDPDLQLMHLVDDDGMYGMRNWDNTTSNNGTGATNTSSVQSGLSVQTTGTGTNNAGVTNLNCAITDERLDASSDSAVSSMGSERVPSLSDNEYMETGSNSSHTQADSHYSMDYASKYRMQYECNYTVNGRNGNTRCQADRIPPVAQKKHQMFGKRYFQEQGTGSPLGHNGHATPIKYEYDPQSVGAVGPGHSYSPNDGAAAHELKYSCSVDFTRHQLHHVPGRTALEHIHHNHTYHLPPDSSGPMRPLTRDKKMRKSESEDQHLTRDEKRARALNVPIAVHDIINLPMDEFNERLSKYDLSEAQLSLIRDIRRRGKNKVAAQNCRKRKLDQIMSLADQVKEMRDRKLRLLSDREYLQSEIVRSKDKFGQLYRHVLQSLRDPDGNQYNPHEYSLQQAADGNIILVPRNQTNHHNTNHHNHSNSNNNHNNNHNNNNHPYHPRQCSSSSMDHKTKPDPERKE